MIYSLTEDRMKLKWGLQTTIRNRTGFSSSYISEIINGTREVKHWPTAKKLAAATETDPILWVEGPREKLLDELSKIKLAG